MARKKNRNTDGDFDTSGDMTKISSLWHGFCGFMRGRFDLSADKASEGEVIENIRKGIEFKGTNLWVLVFATFVASLGLNLNSTAVIIGAMLISPLMGPIMGIGLSVGINDFELMKRSLRNFGFMVLVSIATSTIYFVISPLSNAQSELLSRTVPTIYDVLIALFGGLAGIVAQSRKDRTSTVIPGVAIATALMPPLCTAGFGLATLQLKYFIGAFYLFFINTVFIALATYMVVRFLKYEKHTFLDLKKERKVRRSMILIVLVTLIPSVVIGYHIVKRSIFETNAERYVTAVMKFPKAQVIEYNCGLQDDGSRCINVVLVGDPVSEDAIDNARLQLSEYGLSGIKLIVRQSGDRDSTDFSTLSSGYRTLLSEKNQRIEELQQRISAMKVDSLPAREIGREIATLLPGTTLTFIAREEIYTEEGIVADTILVCLLQNDRQLTADERDRVEKWLKTRTGTQKIKLYTEEEL